MRQIHRRAAGAVAIAVVLALVATTAGGAAPANPRYRLSANLRPLGTTSSIPQHGRFTATLGFDEPLPCLGCGSAWTSLGTLAWRMRLPVPADRTATARIHLGPLDGGTTIGVLCRRCRSSAHGTFHGHLGDHSALLLALLRGDLTVTVSIAGGREQLAGAIRAVPLRRMG